MPSGDSFLELHCFITSCTMRNVDSNHRYLNILTIRLDWMRFKAVKHSNTILHILDPQQRLRTPPPQKKNADVLLDCMTTCSMRERKWERERERERGRENKTLKIYWLIKNLMRMYFYSANLSNFPLSVCLQWAKIMVHSTLIR